MHEIHDLMQGFTVSQVTNNVVYIHVYSIFSPYCDSFCQKLSQYGEKIPYTYVYHIVNYLRNCEALHEIMALVHEMLSVCAP